MKIGIIDADLSWRKKHRFPNLACMKIAGFHKKIGDEVELLTAPTSEKLEFYDKIYLSKVFTDTQVPPELLEFPNLKIGGTGFYFDKAPPLADEIEHTFPDYHLYDSVASTSGYTDHSIGFLTRGCFRKCDFCVNQSYDRVEIHSPLEEFLDPSRPKITLLDDNFFGCSKWKRLLSELQRTGKPFRFVQGLDIRLLTEEKAEMLFASRYCGDFIFAFDNFAEREVIERKLRLARKFTSKNLKFYTFCGFDRSGRYDKAFWERDIYEIFARVEILMRYNALPYITRFERWTDSPYRGMYVNLARWCNQPAQFRKKSFREFASSEGENRSTYRYASKFERKFPQFAKFYDMKLEV